MHKVATSHYAGLLPKEAFLVATSLPGIFSMAASSAVDYGLGPSEAVIFS